MNRREFLTTISYVAAGLVAFQTNRSLADEASLDQLIASLGDDNADFPGAAFQTEAKELMLSDFGAAQPQVGKSKRKISDKAIKLIVGFEVSSRKRYEAKYTRPIWPQGASGVTIGIGYDLGYVVGKEFRDDWDSYIAPETIELLGPAMGKKGPRARDLVDDYQTVAVPYDAAFRQFIEQALPKYIALVENVLSNTDLLSADALGALVSLTYNRGASYTISAADDQEGRYAEMRAIREMMAAKTFSAIPEQVRAMKRLWENKPEVRGLLDRREMEAQLFEVGL